MAFNGTGTFVRLYNWVTDKINSVPITASRMDAEQDGIATGLSNCITKDGQTTVTANIPMNSKKFTGLTSGSALTDSINVGQVQSGQFVYFGATGGDADNYTLTPSPTLTSSTIGFFSFQASATCNAAADMDISARGALDLHKSDGAGSTAAIIAGDIVSGQRYLAYDNATNIVIINPEYPVKTGVLSDTNSIENLSISTAVGSSALTISLKTKADSDPSLSDQVRIAFRSSTATSGVYTVRTVSAATSVVVSSGSTLGMQSAVASDLYVYALDNAGTVELGVSKYLFQDNSIQTSTAEGGAGAADSSIVLYSTTARTSVPVRLIGIINITESTAGTWVSNATTIRSNPINYLSSNINPKYLGRLTATSTTTLGQVLSTGKSYIFELNNIVLSVNGTALTAQYSTDGGSTLLSASYKNICSYHSSSDALTGATNKTSGLTLCGVDSDTNTQSGNNATTGGINGKFVIHNPSQTTQYKHCEWDLSHYNGTGFNYLVHQAGKGSYEGSTSAINYIGFTPKATNSNTTSGVIVSGTIDVWEINA